MGMYTELVLSVRLRKDTPENVIAIIRGLIDGKDVEKLDHPFFETENWDMVFVGGSAHSLDTNVKLIENAYGDDWGLVARSSIKNYDEEYEKFLSWIFPYAKPEGEMNCFCGYTISEISERPMLIYLRPMGFQIYDTYSMGLPDCT